MSNFGVVVNKATTLRQDADKLREESRLQAGLERDASINIRESALRLARLEHSHRLRDIEKRLTTRLREIAQMERERVREVYA